VKMSKNVMSVYRRGTSRGQVLDNVLCLTFCGCEVTWVLDPVWTGGHAAHVEQFYLRYGVPIHSFASISPVRSLFETILNVLVNLLNFDTYSNNETLKFVYCAFKYIVRSPD
jgi:hypothetical protein